MNFARNNQARSRGGRASGEGVLPGAPRAGTGGGTAFTLLELMVVIAIIAIVMGLGLPAIQKLSKPKGLSVANQQLLDDLALARSLALSSRSTVYVLFAPVTDLNAFNTNFYASTNWAMVNELVAGQFTAYALYSKRAVGEQPGREHPRYLTEWKTLPDNIFVPWYEFQNPNAYTFGYTNEFYFPIIECTNRPYLYYLAFSPEGGLTSGENAVISLTQGSIFNNRNADGTFVVATPDILETPTPIESGEIAPGFLYQVGAQYGTTGVINYNGGNYGSGQKFTGVAGVATYSIVSGKPFVKPYQAVELNVITGRGKIVRSEVQ